MLIYPFVKLPLDRRHWARRSKRQSSQKDSHIESGLHFGNMCLCSYRETYCTDPQVSREDKEKPQYMVRSVGNTDPEYKFRRLSSGGKEKKALVPRSTGKKGTVLVKSNLASSLTIPRACMSRRVQMCREANPRWQHRFITEVITAVATQAYLAGWV